MTERGRAFLEAATVGTWAEVRLLIAELLAIVPNGPERQEIRAEWQQILAKRMREEGFALAGESLTRWTMEHEAAKGQG